MPSTSKGGYNDKRYDVFMRNVYRLSQYGIFSKYRNSKKLTQKYLKHIVRLLGANHPVTCSQKAQNLYFMSKRTFVDVVVLLN